MRTVAEAMTAPPATVTPATTIQDASRAMLDADAHAALVVDGGRVCGLATADGIARALGDGHDAAGTPVAAIAESDPPLLRADEALADAHRRMRAAGRVAAPVVGERGEPLGLLRD